MSDEDKRCGTCARWGWRHDVNRRRSCNADFVECVRLVPPGGRFFAKEYGAKHVCHRPDDYESKEES